MFLRSVMLTKEVHFSNFVIACDLLLDYNKEQCQSKKRKANIENASRRWIRDEPLEAGADRQDLPLPSSHASSGSYRHSLLPEEEVKVD